MTTSSLGHPDNQSPALSYTTLAIADESHPLQLLAADRNLNSATATNASQRSTSHGEDASGSPPQLRHQPRLG